MADWEVVNNSQSNTTANSDSDWEVMPSSSQNSDPSDSTDSLSQSILQSAFNTGRSGLKTLGNIAMGIPLQIAAGAKDFNQAMDIYNNGTAAQRRHLGSDILAGAGGAIYNAPADIASSIDRGLGLQVTADQLHGKYYPNMTLDDTDVGTKIGSFLPKVALAAAGGAGAAGLVGDVGALTPALRAAAYGAGAAPPFGQTPEQGAGSNLLLHGIGKLTSLPFSSNSQANKLYSQVAPTAAPDLESVPNQIYKKWGTKYQGLVDSGTAAYQQLPDAITANPHTIDGSPFFDKVNDLSNDLQSQLQKDPNSNLLQEQLDWVNTFKPQKTFTDITGQQTPVANATGRTLNNFQDYMNIDQSLNSLYKTRNVINNPSLKYYYRQLKGALDDTMNNNIDNLPPDLAQNYQLAKSLWKAKSAMEVMPNGKASPFFQAWKNEPDKSGIINGTSDPTIGPGNALDKMLKPTSSSALSDYSAQANHFMQYMDPDDKEAIASAIMNPQAKDQLSLQEVAKNLGKYNDDQKQLIFGEKMPIVNQLESLAQKGNGKGTQLISKVLGLFEGMKTGHPFLGYALGSHLGSMLNKKSIINVPGTAAQSSNISPLISSSAVRNNVALPALLQQQLQTQNVGGQ